MRTDCCKRALLLCWMQVGALVLLLSLRLTGSARAQEADSLAQVLTLALTQGDAARLLEQAAPQVELALLGSGRVYSRMQARYVLMDFFRVYPPVRFEVGEDRWMDPHRFVVGEYWYAQATAPLRIYMRLYREEAGWALQELRVTAGRPKR
ncbi:DUF4783 domain-containing protein [Rhodothermus bifroesti]|jgi:hypothetical protein|nr:DUF4783 domain-containing protein [Rhodothermus bifroesti]